MCQRGLLALAKVLPKGAPQSTRAQRVKADYTPMRGFTPSQFIAANSPEPPKFTTYIEPSRIPPSDRTRKAKRKQAGQSLRFASAPITPSKFISTNTQGDWRSPRSISMSDPLVGFDWTTLYARYDAAASRGYDPRSKHLRGFHPTTNDRDLYYQLVTKAAPETRSQLGADWCEALLYWKLYSQYTLDSKITAWIKGFAPERLQQFLAKIPRTIPRRVSDIIDLVELVGSYQFPGMKSSTALPVRTTFLHILYPDVIPIFDKMVLKAVGAWCEGANQDINVLRQYIPHAWELADKHTQQLSGFKESSVRLVDMALWFKRSPA
jgi:hypothetical protein